MKENISRAVLLLTLAVLSTGLASAANQGNGFLEKKITKGVPDIIYIDSSDNSEIYAIDDGWEPGAEATNINLNRFEDQSFQACVHYLQLDPRVWPDLGPLDVDCYDNKQQFRNLIQQGDFNMINVN